MLKNNELRRDLSRAAFFAPRIAAQDLFVSTTSHGSANRRAFIPTFYTILTILCLGFLGKAQVPNTSFKTLFASLLVI